MKKAKVREFEPELGDLSPIDEFKGVKSNYTATLVMCGSAEMTERHRVFLSATEYHSDADYNSRRVGVVVVVVVVTDFKKWITFLCFDRFG